MNTVATETWFDDAAGPLVRPYTVVRGRSRPDAYDLDMITLVVALTPCTDVSAEPEYGKIISVCQQPLSVAEVSALVHLPLMVIKVLLSDLIEKGYVIFRSPERSSGIPHPDLLRAVLDGIRRL